MTFPQIEPSSIDIRCGRNASSLWTPVKTATVQAGATVGFGIGDPVIDEYDRPMIFHPGYAAAWLSKSPTDDLDAYEGDGDWFRILGVTKRTEQSLDFSLPENQKYAQYPFDIVWGTFALDSYNFTIAKTTPPGKYLLRFEHIYPDTKDTQYYVNCAQVEIVNDGAIGTPGPTAKIPGVYQRGQPGTLLSPLFAIFLHHQ
ncbi:hypothetical protein GGR52DRAFT_573764 [Hypoxylon sp. FL1284]|nr:hypothetical protein GGR52DRAFT_573764 [Hypoxylon sp. FL1284]